MPRSNLLKAALVTTQHGSMSVSIGDPSIEGRVNAIKFINLIARVYAHTAHRFQGVTQENIAEKIAEVMRDESTLSLVAKRGIINDSDAVSLLEALKWTAVVMASDGETKPRIKLALIANSGDRGEKTGENAELALRKDGIWNALVLENFQGSEYHEVYNIMQQGPKYVNVYKLSSNLYDIQLNDVE